MGALRILFKPVVIVPVAVGTSWLWYNQAKTAKTSIPPLHPILSQKASKLPIYDNPAEENKQIFVYIEDPPSPLAPAVVNARVKLTELQEKMDILETHVDVAGDYLKKIQTGEKRILAESEQFLPDALYVIVSGYAGTIFARKRGAILRSGAFLLFSGIAFAIFYPYTSSRVAKESDQYLEKYTRVSVRSNLRATKKQISDTYHEVTSNIVSSWENLIGTNFPVALGFSSQTKQVIVTSEGNEELEPKEQQPNESVASNTKAAFESMYSTRSKDIGLDDDVSGSESHVEVKVGEAK